MTLGDPQPLSRRQARELARGENATQNTNPPVDAPALTPAALRPSALTLSPGTVSSRRSTRHTPGESAKRGEPAAPILAEPAEQVAATASAAPSDPDAGSGDLAEPTLSRRELRALRARQEASGADAAVAAPVEPALINTEPIQPELIQPELIEAELIETKPARPGGFVLIEPERMYAERIQPAPVVPLAAPKRQTPLAQTPQTQAPQTQAPQAQVARPAEQRAAWTPPVGHWSLEQGGQSHEHAPSQSLDELINRGVGAGGIPTTTNALILPSIPNQGPSVSPISNTGEIMITGSFDLPRSLGSTGAHPNLFDPSELDHVMDQLDAEQLGGDSAPVSASRAVSTHASTRGMLTPPKKQRATLPMVLVITTAVLAVSVLALFVTGYLLGIF